MKLKLSILIIFVLCNFLFLSCKKYQEDSADSILIPVNTRITGQWQRYEYLYDENGYYQISEVLNIKKYNYGSHYFTEEYDGITNSSSSSIEWKFSDSKDSLYLRFNQDNIWQDWIAFYINKLTNKELIISHSWYSDRFEFEKM